MTIKEAIFFELDNNFEVTASEKTLVIEHLAFDFDLNESASNTNVDFYELIDETIETLTYTGIN